MELRRALPKLAGALGINAADQIKHEFVTGRGLFIEK